MLQMSACSGSGLSFFFFFGGVVLGLRVSGLGFRGLGFKVWGLGLRVQRASGLYIKGHITVSGFATGVIIREAVGVPIRVL